MNNLKSSNKLWKNWCISITWAKNWYWRNISQVYRFLGRKSSRISLNPTFSVSIASNSEALRVEYRVFLPQYCLILPQRGWRINNWWLERWILKNFEKRAANLQSLQPPLAPTSPLSRLNSNRDHDILINKQNQTSRRVDCSQKLGDLTAARGSQRC